MFTKSLVTAAVVVVVARSQSISDSDCNFVVWNGLWPLLDGECSWVTDGPDVNGYYAECSSDGNSATITQYATSDCSGNVINVTSADNGAFYCGATGNDCTGIEFNLEWYNTTQDCSGNLREEAELILGGINVCVNGSGTSTSIDISDSGIYISLYFSEGCSSSFVDFSYEPGCDPNATSDGSFYTELSETNGGGSGGDATTTQTPGGNIGPFDCNVGLWEGIWPLVENECSWVTDGPDVNAMMVECSEDGNSATLTYYDDSDCTNMINETNVNYFYCGASDDDDCSLIAFSLTWYNASEECEGGIHEEALLYLIEADEACLGDNGQSIDISTDGVTLTFWSNDDCSGSDFGISYLPGCDANITNQGSFYTSLEEESASGSGSGSDSDGSANIVVGFVKLLIPFVAAFVAVII